MAKGSRQKSQKSQQRSQQSRSSSPGTPQRPRGDSERGDSKAGRHSEPDHSGPDRSEPDHHEPGQSEPARSGHGHSGPGHPDSGHPEPGHFGPGHFEVIAKPLRAPVDREVSITVRGARAGAEVTLKLSTGGHEAEAVFLADERGVVDVTRHAPVSGSYAGVDPMGLFWSARPTGDQPGNSATPASSANSAKPGRVVLTASTHGVGATPTGTAPVGANAVEAASSSAPSADVSTSVASGAADQALGGLSASAGVSALARKALSGTTQPADAPEAASTPESPSESVTATEPASATEPVTATELASAAGAMTAAGTAAGDESAGADAPASGATVVELELERLSVPDGVRRSEFAGGVLFEPQAEASGTGAGPAVGANANIDAGANVGADAGAGTAVGTGTAAGAAAAGTGAGTAATGAAVAGVIVLGGSEGGLHELDAALLAGHGFTALALPYFGAPGVPENLVDVPLEHVGAAVDALAERVGGPVGLVGGSRGGELALLAASVFPAVRAVVSVVGSGVVTQCIGGGKRLLEMLELDAASWTWHGQPVPYLPYSVSSGMRAAIVNGEPVVLAEAFDLGDGFPEDVEIPVERIAGPVLLVSGDQDASWPSAALSEVAHRRLKANAHPHAHEHVVHPGAGHLLAGPPNRPQPDNAVDGPGVRFEMGGDRAVTARAKADTWNRTVTFLKTHLTT